jgi:hypothetical protein
VRFTVTSHLTLDGVMQSNGKPEPELNDGPTRAITTRRSGSASQAPGCLVSP